MSVPQRLSRRLQQALGTEAAEDLVNLLNGVELQRSEFRAFRESMRADFAEFRESMRAEFAEDRKAIRAELTAFRTELQATRLETAALSSRIGDVKADLMKWSLVFWTGAVLAIGGLVVALP
ncbi:MAG: hypothetical protein ACREOK_15225 [Gemmatimonadaceae bacterium]